MRHQQSIGLPRATLLLIALLSLPAFAEPIGKSVPVRVEFYRIAVELEPQNQQLAATTTVGLRALASSVQIVPFEIENALQIDSVRDNHGRTLTVTRAGPSYSHTYLLEFPQPLAPGETLEIEFRYAGRMPEKPLDYVASYGILLRDEARWYPIIDLSSVAGLEMRATVPAGWEAITSGELIGQDTAGRKTTFHWRTERPVSSRSLVAGPLHAEVRHLDGFDLYIYLSTQDEALASSLAGHVGDVLRFYSERFGAYPWKRYSIVEGLPRPSGSTGYSAPGFLVASLHALRNARYPDFDPQFLPHEIAHQWFPGEVTMASESDAFIAESLAEYCALLYLERILPAPAFQNFVRKSHLEALAGELIPLEPGMRLFGWYAWPTVYRTLYQRGMLVYRTLDALLGDDAVLRLLREFYSGYRGRTASVGNLKLLAEELSGASLDWFFDLYLKRTNLPEMEVSLQGAGHSIEGNLRVSNVPPSFRMPVEVAIPVANTNAQTPHRRFVHVLIPTRSGDNYFTLEGKTAAGAAIIDPDWRVLFWRDETKRSRAVVQLLRRAVDALNQSDFRAARMALDEASAADPGDLARQRMSVMFWLGRLAFRKRNYQATLVAMSRALSLANYDGASTGLIHAWARIFRGYALERLGRRRAARAEYQRVLGDAEPPLLESPFDLEEFGRITTAKEEIEARLSKTLAVPSRK